MPPSSGSKLLWQMLGRNNKKKKKGENVLPKPVFHWWQQDSQTMTMLKEALQLQKRRESQYSKKEKRWGGRKKIMYKTLTMRLKEINTRLKKQNKGR